MNIPTEYDTAMKELYAKALGNCIMNYVKSVKSEDLLQCMQHNAVTISKTPAPRVREGRGF